MHAKTIQAFWDDVFAKSVPLPPVFSGSEALDRVIETYRRPGQKVLDIGCGNGKVLYLFAKPGKGTYHGLDLSEEAIKKARELFQTTGLNHAFYCGDVSLTTEFDDGSYDCILLFNILDNLEEEAAKRVLKETHRLLEAKGTVLVKLNPYLEKKTLDAYGMKAVKKDFYLEPSGLYILNKSNDYWFQAFEGFKVKESLDLYYQAHEQWNRLFILEKK